MEISGLIEISCCINSSQRTGDMMSGVVLLRIFRSVKVIAKRWVKDVAGDERVLLVGLISLILPMG